jgi:chromosome segregation ATPase
MAIKDKLSKEVEEQIQGLASDVYIQIEDKLTQLIYAATPVKTDEPVNIEETPAYLALQTNLQTSQAELSEKDKNFSEKTNQLEKDINNLKIQLANEQSKYSDTQAELQAALYSSDADADKKLTQLALEKNELKQALDSELAKQKANEETLQTELTAQKQEVTKLSEQLKAFENSSEKSQETHNSELNNAKEEFNKELAAMDQQLQQSQNESAEHKKVLAEQEEKLATLEEKANNSQKHEEQVNELLEQKAKLEEQYQEEQKNYSQKHEQEINALVEQKAKLEEQYQEERNSYSAKDQEQQEVYKSALEKIVQLEKSNQELLDNLEAQQSGVQSTQTEIESLTSQLVLVENEKKDLSARLQANREKQEQENDKVRETIKNLRDENSEVTTVHNEQKSQFVEQINELENKLTEYRLKFGYAQKQLMESGNS